LSGNSGIRDGAYEPQNQLALDPKEMKEDEKRMAVLRFDFLSLFSFFSAN